MAQQREKEESELKVPKNLSLCAPPPIPIPPPKVDESTSSSDLQENQAIHALPTAGTNDPRFRSRSSEDLSQSQSQSQVAETEELENQPKRRSREVNRCSCCRRKVGLAGFRCRCGDLFCSEHRYSDRHDCTFDYKAAGREAIARDNPLVRPAKILKV